MPKSSLQKDVYPQYLNFSVTQTGVNTYTQSEINLPINPAATMSGGRVRIMEFLKMLTYMYVDVLVDDGYLQFQLTTKSKTGGVTYADNPDLIAWIIQHTNLVTSGGILNLQPQVWDFTDGKGNGLLIAVPKIFAALSSGTQGAAKTIIGKILYRYVDVDPMEYVGIVQSQQ